MFGVLLLFYVYSCEIKLQLIASSIHLYTVYKPIQYLYVGNNEKCVK